MMLLKTENVIKKQVCSIGGMLLTINPQYSDKKPIYVHYFIRIHME